MLISRNALPWNFGAIAVSPKKNYKQNQPPKWRQGAQGGTDDNHIEYQDCPSRDGGTRRPPGSTQQSLSFVQIMVVVLRLGWGGAVGLVFD